MTTTTTTITIGGYAVDFASTSEGYCVAVSIRLANGWIPLKRYSVPADARPSERLARYYVGRYHAYGQEG